MGNWVWGCSLRIGLNGSRFELILQPLFTEREGEGEGETESRASDTLSRAAHSFLSNLSRIYPSLNFESPSPRLEQHTATDQREWHTFFVSLKLILRVY